MNAVLQNISLMEPMNREKLISGKIRFGIIGTNGSAKAFRIPALAADPRVTIASVATGDVTQARAIIRKFPAARLTTEALDVVRDSYVDAVLITTRPEYHAPLVSAALKAGKHVWVENPLASSAEELQSVIEATTLHANKPQLMIGFNHRFSPLLTRLRRAMAGQKLAMHYRICGSALPGGQGDGGERMRALSHCIDTLQSVAGAPVASVHAETLRADATAVETDYLSVTLEFTNKSLATLLYTAHAAPGMPGERLEVYSGNKTAVIEDWQRLAFYGKGSPRGIRRRFSAARGYEEEQRAFVDAILAGTPAIPPQEQFATARTIFAIQRALVSGNKESVEPTPQRKLAAVLPLTAEAT
jgi:predicted dehydrogenase